MAARKGFITIALILCALDGAVGGFTGALFTSAKTLLDSFQDGDADKSVKSTVKQFLIASFLTVFTAAVNFLVNILISFGVSLRLGGAGTFGYSLAQNLFTAIIFVFSGSNFSVYAELRSSGSSSEPIIEKWKNFCNNETNDCNWSEEHSNLTKATVIFCFITAGCHLLFSMLLIILSQAFVSFVKKEDEKETEANKV